MVIFLIVLAVAIIVVNLFRVHSWQRMSRKSGALEKAKRTQESIIKNSRENQQKQSKIIKLSSEILQETKIFPFKADYVDEVNKMIAAMDLKVRDRPMTIDDVFVKQCGYSLSSIGLGFMIAVAALVATGGVTILPIVALFSAPMLFKVPLWQLRTDFKEEQITAMSQWVEFYNMYYSQFIQKELSASLADVIENFLPLANPALAKMLKRFKTDVDNVGPEKALDRLKHRYPDNTRIHKFVSVAKMRYSGDISAIDLMKSVQDDLLAEEDICYEKDLKQRIAKASQVITVILFIGIGLLFSVMIYAMIASG